MAESLTPHIDESLASDDITDMSRRQADLGDLHSEMVRDLFVDTESIASRENRGELQVEELNLALDGLELAVGLEPVAALDVVDPSLLAVDLQPDTNVSSSPSMDPMDPSNTYFRENVGESRENVSDTNGQF
jgi:hypothetical protein